MRFILILMLMFSLTETARAQLLLEKGKVTLAVSGGDRIDDTVMINNNSPDEVEVRVYWEDFQYKPPYDGKKIFSPAGTGERSMADWVSFFPREFILPPHGSQEVQYSINVPESVQGGAYGVLFFESEIPRDPRMAKGVNIIARAGCLFFIESEHSDRTSEILEISANEKGIQGVFANKGDVILIPKIVYHLTDEEEMIADRGEVKPMYISPGQTASWVLELSESLSAGSYEVLLTADLGDGYVEVKELTLVKDTSGTLSIASVRD